MDMHLNDFLVVYNNHTVSLGFNCLFKHSYINLIVFLFNYKLGTVHIHDTIYGSGDDSHKLVGEGNLATKNRAWGEVYKTMLATNRYRGVFMFEPKDDQSAAEVMRRFHNIVLESYNSLDK